MYISENIAYLLLYRQTAVSYKTNGTCTSKVSLKIVQKSPSIKKSKAPDDHVDGTGNDAQGAGDCMGTYYYLANTTTYFRYN